MEIRTNKSYMIFYSFISLLIWDFKGKKKKTKCQTFYTKKKKSLKGFKRSSFIECSECMVVNMMHAWDF